MFEQKEIISLDQQSFKALAGTKRIAILKSLSERNKTQSELSAELKLSVPTVKEHLDLLESAGLIQEIDDNHKWKYFSLTRKGQKLMKPNDDMKIMLVLSTSFIAMLAGIFSIILSSSAGLSGMSQAAKKSGSELMKSAATTASGAAPLQESISDSIVSSAVQNGTEAISNNSITQSGVEAISTNAVQNGSEASSIIINSTSSNLNLIALIQNHLPEAIFVAVMLVIFVIFLIRFIKTKKSRTI